MTKLTAQMRTVYLLFSLLMVYGSLGTAKAQIPLPEESAFEKYLKATFPIQKATFPPHPEPRPRSEEDYEVIQITALDSHYDLFTRHLKKHRLFTAWISGSFLDAHILPSITSQGYFATDGDQIHYLGGETHAKEKALETILKKERLPLEKVSAWDLAAFFNTILLSSGNSSHTVISSYREVEGKQGYVVDPEEREKYRKRVAPPAMKKNDVGDWLLEFYTLGGWMHDTNTLALHQIIISSSYELNHTSSIITSRVYEQIPEMLY